MLRLLSFHSVSVERYILVSLRTFGLQKREPSCIKTVSVHGHPCIICNYSIQCQRLKLCCEMINCEIKSQSPACIKIFKRKWSILCNPCIWYRWPYIVRYDATSGWKKQLTSRNDEWPCSCLKHTHSLSLTHTHTLSLSLSFSEGQVISVNVWQKKFQNVLLSFLLPIHDLVLLQTIPNNVFYVRSL